MDMFAPDASQEILPPPFDATTEPTEKYVPTPADEKRRAKFQDRFREMRSFGEIFRKKFDKNHRYYRGWRGGDRFTDADDIWRSDIFVALILPRVESYRARMNDVLQEPLCLPRSADAVEKARKKQLALTYVLEENNAKQELDDAKTQGLIYGTGVVGVFWDTSMKVVKEEVITPLGDVEYVEREVPLYEEQAVVKQLDIYDVFFDPAATSMANMRDCVLRFVVPASEARRMYAREGTRLGRFITAGMGDTSDSTANRLNITQRLAVDKRGVNGRVALPETTDYNGRNGMQNTQRFSTDVVEILIYYDKINDVCQHWVGNLCVVDGPNPYKHKELPIALWRDNKIVGELYGRGEPDLLEQPQDYLNEVRNSRLDQTRLGVFPTLMLEPSSGARPEDIKIGPGYVNTVKNAKAMEWLKPPPVGQDIFTEEQLIRQDAEMLSGMSDINNGAEQRVTDTATGVQVQTQSAQERLNEKLRVYEQEMYTRVLWLLSETIAQYWDEEKVISVTGEEGVLEERITPQDLAEKVEISCKPAQGLPPNKLAIREQWNTLVNVLINQGVVVTDELVKAYLQQFDVKNVDDFIVSAKINKALKHAQFENRQLAVGSPAQVREVYQQDHELHLRTHKEFAGLPEFNQLPLPARALFYEHIQEHERLIPQAPEASMAKEEKPETPVKGTISLNGDDIGPELSAALAQQALMDTGGEQQASGGIGNAASSAVPSPANVTPTVPTRIPEPAPGVPVSPGVNFQ